MKRIYVKRQGECACAEMKNRSQIKSFFLKKKLQMFLPSICLLKDLATNRVIF